MSEEIHKNEPEIKHLEKLTVKELREIAAELPHERAIADMKKGELVAFIKEARGIKDEKPSRKTKHVAKIKMTKPELKAKIRETKVLKGQALESNEKKKILMLRHRISRLKKQSRRIAAA